MMEEESNYLVFEIAGGRVAIDLPIHGIPFILHLMQLKK